MKKLIIAAISCAVAVCAFGQGQVSMNTAGAGAYVKFSNTVANAWAVGDAFRAGLYWASDAATLQAGGGTLVGGPGGTNDTGLAIFTGGTGGFVAGTTFGGNRTIASRAGLSTFFQLRAWSTGFASYEAAVASGQSGVLRSLVTGANSAPVVSAVPTPDSLAIVPSILWGGPSSSAPMVVSLVPVPEPSVIALGVLGLAGALFIRRRK